MSFDHSRQFIGASECASIIGLDDYKTKIAIWDRLANGTVSEDSPLARRGRVFEPALLAYYMEETGHRLLAPVETKVHEKFAFVGATPDGLDQDEPHVVEAKAPSFRTGYLWAEGDIPARYVVQMQIQCAVFGRPSARCVVDLGDRIEVRPVGYDEDLAGDVLDQVAKFHRDYVVTKTPPPPDGSDSYSDFMGRRFPKESAPVRLATPEEVQLAAKLKLAGERFDKAEAEYKRIRQELELRIGDAAGIAGDGFKITNKLVSGRTSVDSKALAAAHPAIALQFTKTGNGYRRFVPTWSE
jgi:putative phage-type endonuclease